MSLKAFHIFFIALSALLMFGFSAWLFRSYAERESALLLTGGALAAIAGIGLIVYGIRFLKKFKHVNFI